MKKIVALVLACLLILAAAGCSSATGKLKKIQKNSKIEIYTDPNFSPFEFQGASGIEGVDIEIAKAIAAELGVTATFTESNFDSILMAIKGGKGDIAISGFTILPERLESVDFSIPYIESVQYLILPNGSDIAVLEDLAGKNVGVAKAYSGQFLLEDEIAEGVLAGLDTKLGEYNSAMEAVLDLDIGRIDAVVMDEYVAKDIVAKNPGMVTIELRYENGDLAAEEYGVMVAKGNKELLDIINAVIKRLNDEGKIQEWVVQFSQ